MEQNNVKKLYAEVRILDVPYHLDRTYEYYIPTELCERIAAGTIVSVPFGRGNRKNAAVVVNIKDTCSFDEDQVKPVADASVDVGLLDSEAMELCRFLCDYTLCTYGEAVKTVVPAAALSRLDEYYRYTGNDDVIPERLSEKAMLFYTYIKARGSVASKKLTAEFGEEAPVLASSLVKLGLIEKDARVREATNTRYITYVSLNNDSSESADDIASRLRSDIQAQIVRLLSKTGRITAEELFVRINRKATPQLSSLAAKGIIKVDKIEDYRNPYLDKSRKPTEDSPLSEEQKAAYDKIDKLYSEKKAAAVLLHGITGSGKTRVIKSMIDRVISDGRGVIMLVPEISLTPQTVGYFCGCYGDRVAVIHSNLSQGERYDAYKRIKKGDADIVIGTRSAIFAPVKNIGMIVIDEEQEHTYKSDTDPKYLAHDIARFRCGKHGALMVLSSATPSLTSYHKAIEGIYSLVEMTSRYGGAELPEVIISDMRSENDRGSVSPVGSVMADALRRVYSEGKQSIVFLNRRGYNSVVSCRVCGEAIKCPHCSVSLTYHTKMPLGETESTEEYLARRRGRGVLACHYCGFKAKVPDICPSCGAEHFKFAGCGTQQAEEELKKTVPGARLIRMDMDTTQTKNSHSEMLAKFRSREGDILLGTQMVTKGHDFPAVTLVGVLNADQSLYLDDYRAAEKTFSMLTQVIGRAGRGKDAGIAIIQTQSPDNEVLLLAVKQDYKTFYEKEIKLRRALMFPPFCDIAVITLSSVDEALLAASAIKLAERSKELLEGDFKDVKAVLFGPFEAPVYKIQNTCRMRMVVKCRMSRRVRQLVSCILCEFGKVGSKNLTVTADFNPSSL